MREQTGRAGASPWPMAARRIEALPTNLEHRIERLEHRGLGSIDAAQQEHAPTVHRARHRTRLPSKWRWALGGSGEGCSSCARRTSTRPGWCVGFVGGGHGAAGAAVTTAAPTMCGRRLVGVQFGSPLRRAADENHVANARHTLISRYLDLRE